MRLSRAAAIVVVLACTGLLFGGPAGASAHRLDFATSALVADWNRDARRLCKKVDRCTHEVRRCFRVRAHRVDCVVGYRSKSRAPRCGVAVSVRLRGRKLFGGSYGCSGRLRPVTRKRFLRAGRKVDRTRFRIDVSRLKTPADMKKERNRYGVPRFDPSRDLYVRRTRSVQPPGAPRPGEQPPPADTTAPLLSRIGARAAGTAATISWTSDEPADSRVEFGTTSTYGQSRSSRSLATAHSQSLTGLSCDTTYHYRVSSADAAGNRSTSPGATFTTGVCPAPKIRVWHGDGLRFGELGFPQRWLNVLGRADDPDGLSAMGYRLDNGALKALVFTPADNGRIGKYGDFNVQLDRLALAPGRHVVTIFATDRLGNQSSRVVEIQVDPPKTWPLPYVGDWSNGPQRTAQVVDGHWVVEGNGVRTVAPGYDRTLALGSESWAGLDVSVPVTIHAYAPDPPHSGVGVATGWRGHEGGRYEPWTGWPLGGFCFYYSTGPGAPHQLYLFEHGWPPFTSTAGRNFIALGRPYTFRIRTEPIDAQRSRYSCKVWPADQAEPAAWHVSEIMDRRDGSVLLVADYADVTFGRVVVNGS